MHVTYKKPSSFLETPQAKRSLGQNFLRDANIARKIVRLLDIGCGDSVLEIGPGAGALTAFVQEYAPARFVLVEKDAYWAAERMRAGKEALVLLADALLMPWERFAGAWKLLGNLPYNVASPLMWDICSRVPRLDKAVFMVQKEVGLRVTAKPGSSAYGALSVWLQSFVRPRLEFVVPPHVFYPRPKVDSAVLSFMPLNSDENKGAEGRGFSPAALAASLKTCFGTRRKQMGTILRAVGHSPAILEQLGIDPRLRPEDLSPQTFQRLAGTGIFTGKH